MSLKRALQKGSVAPHKAHTEPKSVSTLSKVVKKSKAASVAVVASTKVWVNVAGRMTQMTRSEWVKTLVSQYRVNGTKQVVDLTCNKKIFKVVGNHVDYVFSRYKEVLEIASFMVGNLIQSNHKAQTVKSYDKNGIRFI
jgi:hypothetical protein